MSAYFIAACILNSFSQGQCWCNCEPQGGNERFRHHWPRSKRMCASVSLHTSGHSDPSCFQRTGRSMASYCIKCRHCRVNENYDALFSLCSLFFFRDMNVICTYIDIVMVNLDLRNVSVSTNPNNPVIWGRNTQCCLC